MARIAAVVPDLMLQSRVVELLRSAGHEVTIAADPGEIDVGAEAIVADVGEVEPERVAAHGLPVVGFHRHTDPEARRRAERCGIAIVVPRSRMVRELPQLVERALSGRD